MLQNCYYKETDVAKLAIRLAAIVGQIYDKMREAEHDDKTAQTIIFNFTLTALGQCAENYHEE